MKRKMLVMSMIVASVLCVSTQVMLNFKKQADAESSTTYTLVLSKSSLTNGYITTSKGNKVDLTFSGISYSNGFRNNTYTSTAYITNKTPLQNITSVKTSYSNDSSSKYSVNILDDNNKILSSESGGSVRENPNTGDFIYSGNINVTSTSGGRYFRIALSSPVGGTDLRITSITITYSCE